MKIKVFAFVLALFLAGLFYATPYLTLYLMVRAYTDNNMARFIQYIDIGKIKIQMKNEVALLSENSNKKTPAEQMAGELIVSGMAQVAIDQITPENMSKALEEVKLSEK